jgi:hypothetical protein
MVTSEPSASAAMLVRSEIACKKAVRAKVELYRSGGAGIRVPSTLTCKRPFQKPRPAFGQDGLYD